MELQFNLKADGGVERGYEVVQRLRSPADSIHMQVEGFTLRVVLNHPEDIDLNEFVADINARITPDPDGLEFSQ
jgi:hypothetical protein